MSQFFQSFPLGDPINGSPHSVCVSLPRMADVIGYEERDPAVLSSFAAGYPRFFQNPLITELARRLELEGCMDLVDPLFPTEAAAEDLCQFIGLDRRFVAPAGPVWTVRMVDHQNALDQVRAFLQHTGCGLSSREAEAILEEWFDMRAFKEARSPESPESNLASIRSHLHGIYGTFAESDIHLFRSGMNAFYAGFRALQSIQMNRGRNTWIQLGWIYVDTTRILEKFSFPGRSPVTVYQVMDLTELGNVLAKIGREVAGIVTEVPTNPLVQTPDVQVLRKLADQYEVALVLDPTLVSPYNVDVLPFSDLYINSLTKYAAAEADIMMGALALNAKSPFYPELQDLVDLFGSVPSNGDLARMAIQIRGYPEVIRAVNQSTIKVAQFLESHEGAHSVSWAESQPSCYNYNGMKQLEAGPGSIISFSLKHSLESFYDRSEFVKSPSFGARFTMMCPFIYLAHYDLVKTPEGRKKLKMLGVDPDLIRLSVGLEPVEAIIAELDRTL